MKVPTFTARGSLGGKEVNVSVTRTDSLYLKSAAAGKSRANFAAAKPTNDSRDGLALRLQPLKAGIASYLVDLSLESPAKDEVHVQIVGKRRINSRSTLHIRDMKSGLVPPSPRVSLANHKRSRRLLKDGEPATAVIPKGARSVSFTIEADTSVQQDSVELIFTATVPASVASEPALGPFLNGALPNRGPGITQFDAVPTFSNLLFNDPSVIVAHPTEDKFFVAERGGRIYRIDNVGSTATKTPVLDLTANVAMIVDSGLLGFALHPNFMQNGHAYFYYTWKEAGASNEPLLNPGFNGKYQRLSRFTYHFATGVFERSSEQVMIQFGAVNTSHRGGGMSFDGQGFLYLAIGEQSVAGSHNAISSEFLAGIVRLDVDQQGGAISHPPRRRLGVHAGTDQETSGVGYFIPSDNPFLDVNNGLFEEFYCVGTRNPYRMCYDAADNRMWYSEVGDTVEELNLVRSAANFQYPFAEGQNAGDSIPNDIQLGLETPAAIQFPREESMCVIAGFVYRGSKFPTLHGKLIAGDHVLSKIWAISYNSATNESQKEVISGMPFVVGFAEDPRHGEIYCFPGYGYGGVSTPIYKLISSWVTPDAPATLSAAGVFTDTQKLEATPGVRPYEVNMPLWSDGATKRRWIGLPSDGVHDDPAAEQIAFSETGNYRFPHGTVFAKHFELGGRKVETRLLVNGLEGHWYGLSYKWRSDGSDADLVSSDGLTETVSIAGEIYNWRYPGRQECFSCHTAQSGFVLGFRTSQLNARSTPELPYGDNYLTTLSNYGYFDQAVTETMLTDLPRSARGWDDPNAGLGHKVKSYLDSNCAHCHQPTVSTGRSRWDGRLAIPLVSMGLLSSQPIDTLGVRGAQLVMPGVPDGSTLLKRLNSVHTAYAMPPIAKNRIDQEAVTSMAEWIKSLNPDTQVKMAYRSVRSADDLDLSGSFRYAVNVGGPPIMAGDLQFTSDNVTGVTIQAANQIAAWDSQPNLGSSPKDVALAVVFHSVRWSTYPEPITVDLAGLTPGRRYKLQMLFMERCCDRGMRISVNDVDVGEIATLVEQGTETNGTAGGAFVYEFPATAETATIKLAGHGRSDPNPILSGFTLEDLGDNRESWDADSDGLPDEWEFMQAADQTSLGSGDADGDGQSDAAEFASGTNPRAPGSVFSASVSPGPTGMTLEWQSQLGTKYRIVQSNDLSDWTPLSFNISGTGGILTWPMPLDPQADRGFFKVETVPPEAW